MKNLWFGNIQLNSGETLQGDRIGELTAFIINKFADENLSYAEALIVLESAKDVVGDFCSVQCVDWRDERNG